MKTTAFLALSAALFGLTSAAPLNKRDNVLQVVTSEIIETVVLTSTVWVDAADIATKATVQNNGGQFYQTPTPTPESKSTPPPPPPSSTPSSTPPAAPTTTPAPPPPPKTSSPPPPPPPPSSTPPPPPPAPVTTQAPAPAPAPSSQAPAPAPAPQPSSPPTTGGGSGEYSGQMTYYTPGMGACGETSNEDSNIVAISKEMYDQHMKDANPNNMDLCGKSITIYYNGQSHPAQIVDRCEACAMYDLDMPVKMFNTISGNAQDKGRLQMSWSMN